MGKKLLPCAALSTPTRSGQVHPEEQYTADDPDHAAAKEEMSAKSTFGWPVGVTAMDRNANAPPLFASQEFIAEFASITTVKELVAYMKPPNEELLLFSTRTEESVRVESKLSTYKVPPSFNELHSRKTTCSKVTG